MSHDDIQHHVKTYIKVFIALMFLTLLTVYASYVDFDVAPEVKTGAIFVGLFIATVKGFLVASQFMHLNNEKKMIYWVLGLTVFFFIFCLSIPVLFDANLMGDINFEQSPPKIEGGHH
ncbi:MAG: cytochrome C oxidase subunit IV family protein [Candidatus Marinimicrobia bacterium]|nr:cytochrome C oxidase subunit IV family protein [Candidatus Neomarinimicrobiota bacterium]